MRKESVYQKFMAISKVINQDKKYGHETYNSCDVKYIEFDILYSLDS